MMDEESMAQEVGYAIHLPMPKKRIRKSSTKKDEYEAEPLRDKFNKVALKQFLDPLETAGIRHRLYEHQWNQFQSRIRGFDQSWMDELFKNVLKFVGENVEKGELDSIGAEIEIPIGLLVTGENVELMDVIVDKIQESLETSLARISFNKCQNVKSAFQNIAKQLVRNNPNASRYFGDTRAEDEDEESLDESTEESMQKNWHWSLYDINSWYDSRNSSSHVLIVLDEIDRFPEGVMKELLLLLHCFKFPFTLLLGMVSDLVLNVNFFPRDVEFCRIEKFLVPGPTERFENFMEQACFTMELPFRLGGNVTRLLRTYFLHYHFSLNRLLQAYQICLMEHFRKPESLFCLEESLISNTFDEIQEKELIASLESLPSGLDLKKSVKKTDKSRSKSPKNRVTSSTASLQETKKGIQVMLNQCCKMIFEWHECLIFLYEMGKGMPENPIGITKLDLYISASSGSLYEADEKSEDPVSPFNKFLRLVKHFSPLEMEKRFESALFEIENFRLRNRCTNSTELHLGIDVLSEIRNYLNSVKKSKKEDRMAQERGSFMKKRESTVVSPLIARRRFRAKPISRQDMQRELKEKIQAENVQGAAAFAKVKADVILFLKETIRNKLKEFSSISLAEVFVFEDVDTIRKQLFPNIPKEIHLSLCFPANYLHCHCCEETTISDSSIVYKLLREQAYHVVDLNDLFLAFKSFHAPVEPKRPKSRMKKRAQNEAEYLFRFSQALGELQFLGFLKRSKRKTDEATKLCWIFS